MAKKKTIVPTQRDETIAESEEDIISKLPNDILVSILNFLPIKDASSTTILSRRWKHLWKFIDGTLYFDDAHIAIRERREFVDWVNQVLELHQSPTIHEFKVYHELTEPKYTDHINNWINLALKKQVNRLDIDFSCNLRCLKSGHYSLTPEFISTQCFQSLTELRLVAVGVTCEVLEIMLSHCSNLETFSVTKSKTLVKFRLPGPWLKLKHLEVNANRRFKHMEISGVNLVSLKYQGPKITILVEDVPRLVDVFLGKDYACKMVENAMRYSGYLSRLERLSLDLDWYVYERFPRFPMLWNIKELELVLDKKSVDGHLRYGGFTRILRKFPMMQRFVMKISELEEEKRCCKFKVQRIKRPHRRLKVFEIVGFVGCVTDFKLAVYMVNNVVSLEKMIIDPRWPVERRWDAEDIGEKLAEIYDCEEFDEKFEVRKRARMLKKKLPPGVELVIR